MGSYSPESKPKQKINRLFSPIDQTSPGKPTFFEVEKLLICAHYARSLLFGGLILYRKSNICPKILTKREQFFFLSFFLVKKFKFQCKHPFLSYAPKVVFMSITFWTKCSLSEQYVWLLKLLDEGGEPY